MVWVSGLGGGLRKWVGRWVGRWFEEAGWKVV